jgi:hypothetical protein
MTHYFIDDQCNLIKGPMSVDEISKLANEYQDQYFHGQKPRVSIQVTNSRQFHGAGCYEPAVKRIWLAERVTEFENTLKIALLHEMIHANMHVRGFEADPNHAHPPEFKAEVKRLMALCAYDDLLRPSSSSAGGRTRIHLPFFGATSRLTCAN